jgi:hypothetical protein
MCIEPKAPIILTYRDSVTGREVQAPADTEICPFCSSPELQFLERACVLVCGSCRATWTV